MESRGPAFVKRVRGSNGNTTSKDAQSKILKTMHAAYNRLGGGESIITGALACLKLKRGGRARPTVCILASTVEDVRAKDRRKTVRRPAQSAGLANAAAREPAFRKTKRTRPRRQESSAPA